MSPTSKNKKPLKIEQISPASLPLIKILVSELNRLSQPVVSNYQLGTLFFKLSQSKEFRKIPRKMTAKSAYPSCEKFERIKNTLIDLGILKENRNFFQNTVFYIIANVNFLPEEIICSVDPFSYTSHISAMVYHGLTDRLPSTLVFSSPPQKAWTQFAKEKTEKDLGEWFSHYIDAGFPKLVNISFEKIEKRPIRKYASSHLGAFKTIKDKQLRVATIGRTFLDMVREPNLCGGINHVIDIYKDNGKKYESLIVETIERHGTLIEKTRAGYILEELCNIENPSLMKWAEQVQRGGSRKLDPKNEYSPIYSERWALSLNAS